MDRTFAVGDIHGDLEHLEKLLAALPALDAGDTVVFLGDYVDRGPASRQVMERVEAFRRAHPGKCILLRGNHEDSWIEAYDGHPQAHGFLLPPGNGTIAMMRSFVDTSGMSDADELQRLLDVKSWLPAWSADWMKALTLWYEDEHAIYVHAGLDGKTDAWKSAAESRPEAVLWQRNPDFFTSYRGKLLVFGHTPTSVLPNDHLSWLQQIMDDPKDVWFRGDLAGVDTACGKGGFLSALELPRKKVHESR